MIEVSFKFHSVDDAKAFLTGLGKKAVGALNTTEAGTSQPPAPPAGGAAPGGVGAGAAAATPLPGVNVPTTVIPPAPPSAPAPDAAAPQTPAAAAAPQAHTAPDQAALIAAFTALGQAKGRDAITTVLAEFGARTVVGAAGTGIPQDKWAAAIERCKQVLQS
ncbi:MAG TPA: hypothetical protein VF161_02065 [Steroidobacteraceae bacterium]